MYFGENLCILTVCFQDFLDYQYKFSLNWSKWSRKIHKYGFKYHMWSTVCGKLIHVAKTVLYEYLLIFCSDMEWSLYNANGGVDLDSHPAHVGVESSTTANQPMSYEQSDVSNWLWAKKRRSLDVSLWTYQNCTSILIKSFKN